MIKFEQLDWHPHPERPDLGRHAEISFPNGWSATFLDGDFSIYMKRGIYEVQPWRPDDDRPYDGELADGPYHGDAAVMQIIMDLIARQP